MPYVAQNDSPYYAEEYYQPEYQQATYYQPQASTTASWPAHTGTMSGKQRASEDPQTQSQSDDWENISDPAERRKVQNRIAQRKFREKTRQQKEEQQRDRENRQRAGSAYATPEPEDFATDDEVSGLPWGSLSFRHAAESTKAKQESSRGGSSREGSVQTGSSQRGRGSSRVSNGHGHGHNVGLHLSDEFARGVPPPGQLFGHSRFRHLWEGEDARKRPRSMSPRSRYPRSGS